ncbi:MAG: S1 RNA-binding domain-containing protein [Candidatus Micrarchaeota archaeon]
MPYPELDEFVLATVRKIMPFGAVCSLEEYGGMEAFVHISEVSSGWIRNIREHFKEGQLIVAKVVHVDVEKRQIDLSLKRVSEVEKKRKLELHQQSKRSVKLLERAASKAGKTMRQALIEVGEPLEKEYGALFAAFEALAAGEEPKTKIPKSWIQVLREVAQQEIKPKKVTIRAKLSLQSFAPEGLEKIKIVLDKLAKELPKSELHYLGAPNYLIDITAGDFKTAEKELVKAQKLLDANAVEVESLLEKEE